MKAFYWVWLLLCPYLSQGQHTPQFRELQIGDTVPAIQVHGFVNYAIPATTLAAFKGKWLLLDFMATTCGSCIQLLPAFAALQTKYSSRLQILLVTAQPAEKVQAFLQKRGPTSLPVLAKDTILKKFFPHEYISHLVWINPAGKVAAITGGHRVTEANLLLALSGKPLNWPVKKDDAGYDYSQPLFTLNNASIPEAAIPAVKFRFAITGAMANITPRHTRSRDTLAGLQQLSTINHSIPQLFCRLYNQPRFTQSHIRIEAKDLNRFYKNDSSMLQEDWNQQQRYCMEAAVPAQWEADAVNQKLLDELQSYFSCRVAMQTENLCVLLVTKAGHLAAPPRPPAADSVTLGTLLYHLNNTPNSQPVQEATESLGNQWLFFDGPLPRHRDGLLAFLQQQGYTSSEATRNIKVLRIQAL